VGKEERRGERGRFTPVAQEGYFGVRGGFGGENRFCWLSVLAQLLGLKRTGEWRTTGGKGKEDEGEGLAWGGRSWGSGQLDWG